VLTPKDLFARHRGRELQNREWSVTQLKRSLLSEAMLGYAPSKTAGDHFVEYLKEQFNWKPSRTPFHTTAKRGCGRCGAVKPGSEFDVPVTPARPDLNVCRKCSHGKEFK
jgi:hypothetical protein